MIRYSTHRRTEATLGQEQLEVTAAGLQELLVLFHQAFHRIPGQFKCWSNQTSSGLFLYLPGRNTSAVVFTPWGEMDWGFIRRDATLQEVFEQLAGEVVLQADTGHHTLRGELYALQNVRERQLPPSILAQENHALEARAAQQSFEEHFPDFPNCLPISW